MITKPEYTFLTSQWSGPREKEFKEVFESARCFGWCAGFDAEGRPVLTKRGVKAMKAYEAENND